MDTQPYRKIATCKPNFGTELMKRIMEAGYARNINETDTELRKRIKETTKNS